jgi:hypothetical protein
VLRYNSANGKVLGRLKLTPTPPTTGLIGQAPAQDGELVWIGGMTYALNASATNLLWTARTGTVPTISSSTPVVNLPSLTSSILLVPGPDGVNRLDSGTGKVAQTSPVSPTPKTDSRAYPVGTGFVLADAGTAVYR